MSPIKRALLFVILPALAVLIYPPAWLSGGIAIIVLAVAFFIFLGVMLWRGRSVALTFSIFLQGMNVIIRLMMFFSRSVTEAGVVDVAFIIASLIGMALSIYLLLRLDKSDIRVNMLY